MSISKGIDLSFIMPILNLEDYTAISIQSVLNQNIEKKELVIIADNSVIEEVKKLFKSNELIYVVSNKKTDSGSRRNLGIQAARGKYIMFVDSDDRLYSNDSSTKLYNEIEKRGVNVVGGSCVIADISKKNIIYRSDLINYSFEKHVTFKDFQVESGFYRFIYNTDFIRQNLNFPEFKRFQDCIFLVNVLEASNSFFMIPDIVYVYRKMGHGRTLNADQLIDHLKGVLVLLRKGRANGYSKLIRRMILNIKNTKKIRKIAKDEYYNNRHEILTIKHKLFFEVLKNYKISLFMPLSYLTSLMYLVR